MSPLTTPGKNLAERLGFSNTERLLIIHADDMGMCHSVNAASVNALLHGVATCGSVMVPCPWFPEVAAWAGQHPEADTGIHLTLTSEYQYYRWGPVASHNLVPSLVDADGFLWPTNVDVQENAQLEEVELELRAQIERALHFGIRPTHMDVHMGVLYSEALFPVLVKLSREYQILPMLLTPGAAERRGAFAGYHVVAEALAKEGYPLIDRLAPGVGRTATEDERRAQYAQIMQNLRPGVTKLIVHLNGDDDEVQHIHSRWAERYWEYRMFADADMQEWLHQAGVRLIGYRHLEEFWKNNSSLR